MTATPPPAPDTPPTPEELMAMASGNKELLDGSWRGYCETALSEWWASGGRPRPTAYIDAFIAGARFMHQPVPADRGVVRATMASDREMAALTGEGLASIRSSEALNEAVKLAREALMRDLTIRRDRNVAIEDYRRAIEARIRAAQPAPTPSGDDAETDLYIRLTSVGAVGLFLDEYRTLVENRIRAESAALREARREADRWKASAYSRTAALAAAEERLREVEGERDRLRAGFAGALRLAAIELDMRYPNDQNPEAQTDLRALADAVENGAEWVISLGMAAAFEQARQYAASRPVPAATPSTDEEGRA